MKAVEFPEQNDVLGAGDNINTVGLPICRTVEKIPRGVEHVEMPCMVSKWELTDEEIEYIKEHRSGWLMVRGHTHPPLYLMAEHPFVQQ
jgi:hypothetical protein